ELREEEHLEPLRALRLHSCIAARCTTRCKAYKREPRVSAAKTVTQAQINQPGPEAPLLSPGAEGRLPQLSNVRLIQPPRLPIRVPFLVRLVRPFIEAGIAVPRALVEQPACRARDRTRTPGYPRNEAQHDAATAQRLNRHISWPQKTCCSHCYSKLLVDA